MGSLIRFLLLNSPLTFLVLGPMAGAISLWRRPRPLAAATVVEELFAWFLFFSIAIAYFVNFPAHTIFGRVSARFIGWEESPFQAELGWASLGFSLIGFIAFRGCLHVRAAAVVGTSCFFLGAAGVHVSEMIRVHNFEPGNAGVVLYTDILIPVLEFVLAHRGVALADVPARAALA